MLKPILSTLAAVAVLAACEPTGTTSADSGADPMSGSWRILSIGGTKVEDANATMMTFTGLTTVTGSFGCGEFTGNYTYDRNVLFITNIAGSPMACSGAPERQNRHGMRLLSLPMTVVADANGAILSGREGQSFALGR
ncbi:META domain-containing protein [Paracoccus suum]|uniref:META domain-containing protein n=1 Tax=Paracoccus suum TaxID=2259340 RepID=A0A344PJI3_9RHOB|nr:META domain-containing protein [Paracoccus suum]AXC49538.1 META domain-containing protein [Paracoccus suum]